MDKLKELYNKYINWIVIILILLLGMKSCQSCQRSRQIHYYKQNSAIVVDSLQDDVRNSIHYSDSLKTEISLRDKTIERLSSENKILKETNNYYKSSNKELIKNLNKE